MARFEAEALLFDMDGVLLSSIASAERSWKRWAQHYQLPDWQNFQIPHGVRAGDIIKMVAPHVDPVESLRLIEDIEVEDVSDVQVLPGAGALLESLPQGRWTIVTSATKRLMEARVKAAGLPLPERFITADDVTKGKPDPEPYRKGAQLLGFDPAQCVVVEDAPSGMKAGHAAGARVLGVVTSHTLEQVREAKTDWIARSLQDVRLVEVGALLQFDVQTA